MAFQPMLYCPRATIYSCLFFIVSGFTFEASSKNLILEVSEQSQSAFIAFAASGIKLNCKVYIYMYKISILWPIMRSLTVVSCHLNDGESALDALKRVVFPGSSTFLISTFIEYLFLLNTHSCALY